jgi:hypothetical protein
MMATPFKKTRDIYVALRKRKVQTNRVALLLRIRRENCLTFS